MGYRKLVLLGYSIYSSSGQIENDDNDEDEKSEQDSSTREGMLTFHNNARRLREI